MYSRSHHLIVMAPVVFVSFIIFLVSLAVSNFGSFFLTLPYQTVSHQPHIWQ